MKRPRDIPTAAESRALDELTRKVRRLPLERQKALAAQLDARALFDGNAQTVTLAQIAAAYNVGMRTLQRYIAAGDLKAARLGRSYHCTQDQVREWIERRSVRKVRE